VCEPGHELLEPTCIFRIERIHPVGIYVENGHQITLSPKNRDYNLGPCSRVAGNVTWIFLDVRNDQCPSLSCGVSTDTSAERYVEAAKASLIWAHAKQPTWLDDSIEASP